MRKPREILKRPDVLKVAAYLSSSWDILKADRLSPKEVEERVQTATGVVVPIRIIGAIAKDMDKDITEITPLKKRMPKTLRDRPRLIAFDMLKIVDLVEQLFKELGTKYEPFDRSNLESIYSGHIEHEVKSGKS